MPNVSEVAQLVGSLGSVLVAAVAIIVNNRTTRANLDAQHQTTVTQLDQQREALKTTLAAQAQQVRDERLWDRRMALYEDLGTWSGKAYSSVSLLMFEINALPAKGFEEGLKNLSADSVKQSEVSIFLYSVVCSYTRTTLYGTLLGGPYRRLSA